MTCYSTGLVQDLGRKGVKCTLTNHLYDDKEGTAGLERLRKPDLTAFPWAVVEVKPDDVSDSTEVFCFNQAANASAAAVRMYKRLIGLCPGLQALHIPPVVAYTCVGAAVKVWLTCCDNEGQKTVGSTLWCSRQLADVQVAHGLHLVSELEVDLGGSVRPIDRGEYALLGAYYPEEPTQHRIMGSQGFNVPRSAELGTRRRPSQPRIAG